MKSFMIRLFGLGFLFLVATAQMCTKVVTYGRSTSTDVVTRSFAVDMTTALNETQKAMTTLGYQVLSVDESRNRVTAGWRPTTSDSHYMDLFGRKDFAAATGAYYQLVADFSDDAGKVKVSLSTTVQSVAGKLSSSKIEEEKFFNKLEDYLRSPQILMTNVGVQGR